MKKILSEQGGFVRVWFKPDRAVEAKIKEQTKATVRCIPLDQPGGSGHCIFTRRKLPDLRFYLPKRIRGGRISIT